MKCLLNQRTKIKGIGLLELMLSLAIIAILLVMATRYFGLANRSQELNHSARDASFVMASLHNWKGGRSNYNGISTAVLKAQGLLPEEINKDGRLPTWDGCSSSTLTIDPTGSNGEQAQVVFNNISPAICTGLANRMDESSTSLIESSRCEGGDADVGTCGSNYTLIMN